MSKIYVSLKDIPKTSNRLYFLKSVITLKKITTYHDEECTKIQCNGTTAENSQGTSRSVTDLLMIMNSRFETSLEYLLEMLKKLNDTAKRDTSFSLIYCRTIQKVVVKYGTDPSAKWVSDYSSRHYLKQKGVDGYSIADYNKILENKK